MAIEIVDFPSYKMVIFHCKMLVHQRVCLNMSLQIPSNCCWVVKGWSQQDFSFRLASRNCRRWLPGQGSLVQAQKVTTTTANNRSTKGGFVNNGTSICYLGPCWIHLQTTGSDWTLADGGPCWKNRRKLTELFVKSTWPSKSLPKFCSQDFPQEKHPREISRTRSLESFRPKSLSKLQQWISKDETTTTSKQDCRQETFAKRDEDGRASEG